MGAILVKPNECRAFANQLHRHLQGFADPFNFDRPFIYPANTGISYSFTDDGYFEEAQVSARKLVQQLCAPADQFSHSQYRFNGSRRFLSSLEG